MVEFFGGDGVDIRFQVEDADDFDGEIIPGAMALVAEMEDSAGVGDGQMEQGVGQINGVSW